MIRIYGNRVAQARVLSSRTGADLAEAVGHRPDQQTRLEKAMVADTSDEVVEKLSMELGFPIEFFTRAPSEQVSEKDLLFRAPAAITKREKRYLAEFARTCGEVLEVLDGYHKLPGVRLPRRDPGNVEVDAFAAQARSALGYRLDEPIPNLTNQVERAGVPVVMRSPVLSHDRSSTVDRAEKHLAFSTWLGPFRDRPLIVTRPVASWERTRWSLAHEVGHLCLHWSGGVLGAEAEAEASRFASELLAPAEQVKRTLPKHVTLSGLLEIKMRWGISIGSLITHLHTHDLISDTRFNALRTQIYTRRNPETGRTWGMDEPGYNARTPERPTLLRTWMNRGAGASSPAAFAALPGVVIPPRLVREMVWAPRETTESKGSSSAQLADGDAEFTLAPVLELKRR